MEYRTYKAFSLKEAQRKMRSDAGPYAYVVEQKVVTEPGIRKLFSSPEIELTVGIPQHDKHSHVRPEREIISNQEKISQPKQNKNQELISLAHKILEDRRKKIGSSDHELKGSTREYPLIHESSSNEHRSDHVHDSLKAFFENQEFPHKFKTLLLAELEEYLGTYKLQKESSHTLNSPFFSAKLACALEKMLLIDREGLDRIPHPVAITLSGPTGAGKTSTTAKLATHFLHNNRHLRVRMMSLDSYRVGAAQQLKLYADILGCEYSRASSREDIKSTLNKHDYDVLLVDTPGRSPQQHDDIAQVAQMMESFELERFSIFVAPATGRYRDLSASLKTFSFFRPEGLIITKLDETRILGPILAFINESQLPWLFSSNSQDIPTELCVPDLKMIAKYIVQ